MSGPNANVSPWTALIVVPLGIGAFIWYGSTTSLNHTPTVSNVYAAPPPPAAAPKPACAPSDFTLSKVTYEPTYGSVRIKGIIRHACPVAAGVQLKWTAYNKDGSVAFVNNFWPASTVNIQAGTDYAFQTINSGSPQIARYEVAPVDVHVW